MADYKPFEEIEAEKFSLLNLYWQQGRDGLEDRLRYMTNEEMFFQYTINMIRGRKFGLFEAMRSSDFVPDEFIYSTQLKEEKREEVPRLF